MCKVTKFVNKICKLTNVYFYKCVNLLFFTNALEVVTYVNHWSTTHIDFQSNFKYFWVFVVGTEQVYKGLMNQWNQLTPSSQLLGLQGTEIVTCNRGRPLTVQAISRHSPLATYIVSILRQFCSYNNIHNAIVCLLWLGISSGEAFDCSDLLLWRGLYWKVDGLMCFPMTDE